jgi:archaellum biogenesis ATPase FlaH
MEEINEVDIRKWWEVEKRGGQLTEVRIVGDKTFSGYFKNIENLLSEIKHYTRYNCYATINALNEGCYGREQCEHFIQVRKDATSDNDIIGRDEVIVDIDPVRVSNVNSTDEELALAKKKANEVYQFLKNEGFNQPLVVLSGNGVHLRYKCAMKPSAENTEIVKNFLMVLDMLFSDEKINIDTTIYNLSRIIKIPGTYSRKGGKQNKLRPQRLSGYVKIPDDFLVTPNEYFAKVASMLPKPEEPNRSNNFQKVDNFDLDAFLSEHNIGVRNIVRTSKFTKYVLDECPFNSSHKAPDSAIFVMNTGGYGFKCLHSSCSQYSWKDFRLKFDPTAYDRKEYQRFEHKVQYYSSQRKEQYVPLPETEKNGKKWLSMTDIKYVDVSKLVSIPTGYIELDKRIVGLLMGDVSVVSGISGSGKSAWLNNIALNAVQRGYKIGLWSGELQDFRLQSWIDQVAAGKAYTIKKEGYENYYYTPKNISEKINKWLDGRMFVYNNNYGSKWGQLFTDIKELVEKEKVQLIILDNLMALQIDDYDGSQYERQTKFINSIKEYAKTKNIHIILVAHPRKDMGFLRKESISGTADLVNLADNLFIIHRVGRDFETRAGEFLGKDKIVNYLKYSSVIEVCKNRSMGVIDYIVGMYYEHESRRLKNDFAENIVYNWQELGSQQNIEFAAPIIQTKPEVQDMFEDSLDALPFAPSSSEEAPF